MSWLKAVMSSRWVKLAASLAIRLVVVWFSLRGKDLGEVWGSCGGSLMGGWRPTSFC